MALVGQWLVNGSLLDKSGNGNNGTLTAGNGGFRKTERGLAMKFDGNATAIDLDSEIDLGITNTISFWYKYKTLGDAKYFMGSQADGDFGFRYNDSNLLVYLGGAGVSDSYNVSLVSGQWYHITLVRTGNTTIDLYIDGDKKDTLTDNGWTGDNTKLYYIGKRQAGLYIGGNMQDVRAYNTVLTTQEVEDIYNDTKDFAELEPAKKNFVYRAPKDLSNESGLIAAYNMEQQSGTVIDISSNNNNGAINGALDTKGLFSRALAFDGSDDYIDCGTDSSLTASSGGFSVSAWVKVQGGEGSPRRVVHKGGKSNSVYDYGIIIRSDNKISFSIGATSANIPNQRSTNAVFGTASYYNRWMHIVGTWDGSGTPKIYVNGVEEATGAEVSLTNTATDNLYFGAKNDATQFWNGLIDEVRIYDKELTVQEVKDLYNKGAEQISLREGFSDSGADGVNKLPREWKNGTTTCSISELSTDANSTLNRGTKYMKFAGAGTMIYPITLQGNEYISYWYYNGSTWVNRTGLLDDPVTGVAYSGGMLTFTSAQANDGIAKIVIQRGQIL